ncbi:MAG TPA: zincin-like metallopeptidase domain-containing protein [Candidatus Propionivibrio aalborgensis]|nr:zincin-like metallopeptidase domain-containing protein [Candidatus Propionivibrio aalborgensis]
MEAFFAATGAQIDVTEEPRAYYNITTDRIHMPPIETFHRVTGYYGTLAHEVATPPLSLPIMIVRISVPLIVIIMGAMPAVGRLPKFTERRVSADESMVQDR